MCGIAGFVDPDVSRDAALERVRRMLAMIRHRGPDEFGVYAGHGVGLGSARLSIIDLSTGGQPISNEDGTLWIVFNGEIFNYIELREGLEKRGHRFKTHTDTEVLLHLFEESGPACLESLNGQFAFAIWNERDRSLFLARDRIGIRPLYYMESGRRLLFGSEIKELLTYPGVRTGIDPVSLEQIFVFWSTLPGRSVFQGIKQIPPGHYMLARDGAVEVRPYWRLRFTEDRSRDDSDWLEEFRALLIDATVVRLRADVPVGAYLSGGLDSSIIAALVRRHAGNRLETFSIAFTDPLFDESIFQRRMAEHLGTEHHVICATHEDIGRVFPEVVWHTEQPIMRTAPVPMYLLSGLVRQHGYKVVLTGEGADEFLGGYDIFKEALVRRFWARQPGSRMRPRLFTRLYADIPALAAGGAANLAAFFRAGLEETGSPHYSHMIRWRNTGRARRFFSADLRAQLGDEPVNAVSYAPEFQDWSPLARAQYLEGSIFLPEYLLSSQGDRVAMAHSVEGRLPFLDYRVVEFCNRLPSNLKIRVLREKYLLRRLAADYLPKEIGARPKRPYRAPVHRSFFSDNPPAYLDDLLGPERIRQAGLFDAPAVAHLVRKLGSGMPVGETDQMALAGIVSAQLTDELFLSHFRHEPDLPEHEKLKICFSTSDERRAVN
jgi:asparagine synthase (glutamine-hydrolysing)